jgi:hypothetical protein
MGSVAERLMEGATYPVLVLPRKAKLPDTERESDSVVTGVPR